METKDCLYHISPTLQDCLKCELYIPEHTEKYETYKGIFEEETIKAECLALDIS